VTCFLFPGQGSQKNGMGRDIHDASPAARRIFDQARELLGPEFVDLIFNGTEEQLRDTRVTQPALVTVESAIVAHLAQAGLHPAAAAGHSVGELSALVAAGSLDFVDALRLAQERARLMTEEAPAGGMAAVIGLDAKKIQFALSRGVEVANYNGPAQTIISGEISAIETISETLKTLGAQRVIPLNVSGPFHCSLMKRASELLRPLLNTLTIRPPACTFVSSVIGEEVSDPDLIRLHLGWQLYSPVRWTDVMTVLGPIDAIEVGPGNVLQGLARRTPGAAHVHSAGTWPQIQALTQKKSVTSA
jgi:[acyl-carrier-protein] S-malonyltransferase